MGDAARSENLLSPECRNAARPEILPSPEYGWRDSQRVNPLTYDLRPRILGRKCKQAIIYYIIYYIWADHRTMGYARSCRLRG